MKRIKIADDKELDIRFTMRDIVTISDDLKVGFSEVVNGEGLNEMSAMVTVARVGLNSAASKNGQANKFTEDDVWEMVDEYPEIVGQAMGVYVDAVSAKMERVSSSFGTPTPPKV